MSRYYTRIVKPNRNVIVKEEEKKEEPKKEVRKIKVKKVIKGENE